MSLKIGYLKLSYRYNDQLKLNLYYSLNLRNRIM